MSTLTGILLDVSASMKENATGNVDAEGGEWARSIFTVINDLIKHDVTPDNHVFAVAVGASCDRGIFDIIGTIEMSQDVNGDVNESYDDIIKRIFNKLERNGAYSVRNWAGKAMIIETVSYEMALIILKKLECDQEFLRRFVDECLPRACKNLLNDPLNVVNTIQCGIAKLFTKYERGATETDIINVISKAKDLMLKPVNSTCIVSVHKALEVVRGCVREREITKERANELMKTVEPFIYGRTPLYEALETTSRIFHETRYQNYRKLLFVLSDGEPTDTGNVEHLIAKLKSQEVTVVSCFITKSRNVEPKRLYSVLDNEWENSAKLLFKLSSTIPTQLLPRTMFIKQDWKIDVTNNETKLFLHVNHPRHLSEACDFARDVVQSQDALSDLLASVSLDMYINQSTTAFKAQKQEGGTCYANASAAVLHLSMKRIHGREGGYPDFNVLRQKMIDLYGKDGADTLEVLKKMCPNYRLRCKKVDVIEAMQAIAAKRPVVAKFRLTDDEWDIFLNFYERHPKGILTQNELDITRRPKGVKLGGHAVVLTSYNSECLHFMNSWGCNWAAMGFFKVQNSAVLGVEFIDVYWTESDLTEGEKVHYQKHGPEVAAKLMRNLQGLQKAEYTCPLCSNVSLVSKFTGNILEAQCPKCKGHFKSNDAGNILAMNMYLLSLCR